MSFSVLSRPMNTVGEKTPATTLVWRTVSPVSTFTE